MSLFIIWIIFCFIVAAAGNNKPIGYWGVFGWSILLSPLIGLIIALASKDFPAKQLEFKCRHCKLLTKENTYYCPRCGRDDDGYTQAENYNRTAK